MNWTVAGIATTSLIGALAISGLLTPLVRQWALRTGFVDHPAAEGHKSHKRPVSLGGGIAITIAIVLPIVVVLVAAGLLHRMNPERLAGWWGEASLLPYWIGGIVQKTPTALAIIAGALTLHLLGIIDDHWPLSPYLKLTVQFLVAIMLTAGFGIRAGDALGHVPSIALTTLWIVAVTNAFNFMDNMDGLTAGVAGIIAILLAISAFLAGQIFVPCLLLVVAGAVLGFLIYNFPPASVFMGDSGSLVVGYTLAVLAVLITFYDPEQNRTPFGTLVPLVVFAVPLYDMASVMVYRLRLGVSVFRGDRRHFSHRLVKMGMSPTTAVLTIYLATTATALPALLLPMASWSGAAIIVGQCVCVVTLIALLESHHAS